jgi:hypothetical protein
MSDRRKTLDELFCEHFFGELQDANERAAAKEKAIPPAQPVLICRGVDLDDVRKQWRGK